MERLDRIPRRRSKRQRALYGNRKFRKRVKMKHRAFTRSPEFVNHPEPYRSHNLTFSRSSSIEAFMYGDSQFRVRLDALVTRQGDRK